MAYNRESMHDVAGLVDQQVNKGSYPDAWTWGALKSVKHALPKWIAIGMSILTIIIIEAHSISQKCRNRNGVETGDFGADQIDGMGFLVTMLVTLMLMDGIYLALYFFVGLNRLTNLGWAKPLANGGVSYSVISWWMLELSSHVVVYALLFIGTCVAAAGIASATDDLKNVEPETQGAEGCTTDGGFGAWDFCIAMGFFMLGPVGFTMYFNYKKLQEDHGLPECPCSRNSNTETTHSV
jgi:hypothetical protein